MRLLLIDGSNIVMRCAFGGEIQPEPAVRTAVGQIRRFSSQLQATHMVICLDLPGVPSWRKKEYPEYKANREIDTSMWLDHAEQEFIGQNWKVAALPRFEAVAVAMSVIFRSRFRPKSSLRKF